MKVKFFTSVFAKKVFKTKGSQIQSVLTIYFCASKEINRNTGDRTRTDMFLTERGILSPLRLPIPPHRRKSYSECANSHQIWTNRQYSIPVECKFFLNSLSQCRSLKDFIEFFLTNPQVRRFTS